MEECENKIIIKGLDIPFWDMVVFLVKFAFASIPALFIISFVFWLVFDVIGWIFSMTIFHIQ